MSIARKDDRHNDDLVNEIADSFNRALGAGRKAPAQGTDTAEGAAGEPETTESAEPPRPAPRFVVTGDKRVPPPKNRRSR